MKFLHMADMHFDAAFKLLSSKSNLGQLRRLDQRAVFNNIIDIIKSEHIKYLFISGDLYEQKFIRESTIDYINSKFLEIPDTYVFISPGNHDPFIKNSFYNTYSWASNVKIFGSGELEMVETPEANIYGLGFTDYNYSYELNVDLDKSKLNILVMHASLDGQDVYNPITTVALRNLGFDYVALGHIHKTNFGTDSNIIYPGSPVSMGFDELGEHGIILGDFSDKLHLQFIKTDDKEFVEMTVDVTEIKSVEELVENINSIAIKDNEICKIILTGSKNFSLVPNILDLVNDKIIKIKDKTTASYDLEAIANENSLKGLFVRNLLNKLPDNKEEVEKAISIGLELFD